uniref:Uncharacterized protein n=1 Tax=Timspurckia oligopyrenoides TaxID=708627 RepID=A0A7S0ZDT4_9RHOD|mmetsp:Transcript_1398/g.2540  ORF Transcript_1398/g.2540 Transcript_1398/m.2540 type:complete len:104 (+) Transcript_1398:93-404(+)
MSKNIIARVAQWLANELIVKGLANNPSFQRFAVRTHEQTQKLAEKAAKSSKELAESESVRALKDEAEARARSASKTAIGLGELLMENVKKALYHDPKSKQPPK